MTIRLWDVATLQQISTLKGHTEPIISVAFDGNGRYIASGRA
jgi:WD40 repeat protein